MHRISLQTNVACQQLIDRTLKPNRVTPLPLIEDDTVVFIDCPYDFTALSARLKCLQANCRREKQITLSIFKSKIRIAVYNREAVYFGTT